MVRGFGKDFYLNGKPVFFRCFGIDLEVMLTHGEKTINSNNWSFWSFPAPSEEIRGIADPASGGRAAADSNR